MTILGNASATKTCMQNVSCYVEPNGLHCMHLNFYKTHDQANPFTPNSGQNENLRKILNLIL